MSAALIGAVLLIVAIGLAHSILGERYILTRLFRRDNLPELFGSTEFTQRTLRFAWHITTVAWFGLAAMLVAASGGPISAATTGKIVGATFLIHFAIALLASKGRHFSWVFFLAIGLLAVLSTR